MISVLISLFTVFANAKPSTTNFKQKLSPPAIEESYESESTETVMDLTRYFRENNCEGVIKYSKDHDFLKIKPLELAIIASCEPPGKDPEKIFSYAETKDPSDDAILLLHGRYRWKKYKLNSNEIWEKLINQSKNQEILELAKQYLDGNGLDAEVSLSAKVSRSSSIQVGEIFETNPDQLPKSDPNSLKDSSFGVNWNLISSKRIDYSFGYINWSGSFSGTQYNSASSANLLLADISPTFALESSLEQYFLFRPSINGFTIDGHIFNTSAGVAVGELWQYPTTEFKLLFSLFGDRYYQPGLENQSGTHYLLEQKSTYKWNNSQIYMNFFWLKTNTSQDTSTPGQVIPYSNATGGLSLGYQWTYKDLILGSSSNISFRQDDSDTQYLDAAASPNAKKRKDRNSYFEVWGSLRFTNDLSGLLFFSTNQTMSNFSEQDYIDRNSNDSVSGLSLKYSY